ncbi:MAG: aminotransferase class III-fold pyridoxal phosphate-dependent enzyme [Verrucomicrobia bacterium]|nr:aminotransferase class III-fold pyridoxal phosphate-dependent enzyme [Verrucomicrobiota bacterium]
MPSSSSPSPVESGPALYVRAKRRIPGGTQLLSKRPEMYLPDQWPAYYQRAEGCTVWDVAGRPYVDFTSCGIGTCLLGYADPTVNAAVVARIAQGSMCTLNTPDELAVAELLCSLHPWAEKVRYARAGGEAMSIAIRIARAATRRDLVAFCGYHGWGDWYLAANLGETEALNGHLLPGLDPAGVPAALRGTALPFRYNRIAELEAIVAAHRGELAAIVMEPMRHDAPRDGFLQRVRALADETGAVLVFDEVTAGWRSHHGGIHLTLGVNPDIAVFAKAISNGFPMAAVIGRGAVMEAAQQTFVSSTYWTESIGPAAALATLQQLPKVDAVAKIREAGEATRSGWQRLGAKHGLPVKVGGLPALATFAFDAGEDSRPLMTLFTQGMLERGYLANGGFYPMVVHTRAVVEAYLAAVDAVFADLRRARDLGAVRAALHGPVAHAGFARLT